MKKYTVKHLFLICIVVLFITLMVVGSIFDYQISKALSALPSGQYLSANFALQMSEIFGETVLYGALSVALLAIFLSVKRVYKGKKATILSLKFVPLLACFLINAYGTSRVMYYAAEHYDLMHLLYGALPIICYALGGVAFSGVWYVILVKFNDKILISLSIWSLIVIFTALFSQITVQGLKLIFLRPRFRVINYLNDESLFVQWFKIKAIDESVRAHIIEVVGSDGLKSFPSGHTASAAILITLTALPSLFDKLKNKKFKMFLSIAVSLCIVFVSMSRIIIGAHYLTDVVFALCVTFFIYYLVKKIVFLRFNRIISKSINKTE